jgi:hypothetical protein
VSVIISTMDSRLVLGLMLLGACDAQLGNGTTTDGGGNNSGGDGGMKNPDGGTDGPSMLGPWGTPAKVPGADTARDEDDATLSSSRLECYFKRGDTDSANLYVMTRASANAAFGAPVALTVLNSTVDEESPRLSQDDLTLYFGRNGDIYKSTRTAVGSPWGAATAVASLNTAAYEKWAAVCSNGYAMVSRAVTNEGQNLFDGDITNGANNPVAQLNSTSQEQGTFLSTDCLRLYYQSNRDNAQFNLLIASRVTMMAAWSNPTSMTDFNTATFNEEDPWISSDQKTFVYSNNSAGNKDVYIVTR